MSTSRFVPTEGIHNLRDYGGWPVVDGGQVVTGVLYRSGQHVGATSADLASVAALDIVTIVDLRGTGERARHPCRRAPGWAGEVLFHDGETSNAPPHLDAGKAGVTEEAARTRMEALYRRIPHNPAMHAMFARYLAALAEREGASLIHCFAGKDRTGIAVAVLHHLLGVTRADARRDFLLTNEAPTYPVLLAQSVPALEERFGPLTEGAVDALMNVDGAYFDAFYNEVESGWGSLDAWLAEVIGVDDNLRRRLRKRLVT